jgi:hypothetical protein
MNIDDAKTALPFPALLNQLGIPAPDRDKFEMRCPLHHEEHGESFSVERKNGTWLWNCFGKCNRGGDEITFIEVHKSVPRDDAIKLYLEMASGNGAIGLTKSDLFPEKRWHGQRCNGPVINPGCVASSPASSPALSRAPTPSSDFDWQRCVAAVDKKEIERLLKLRGYSPEFCWWLKENNLLGIVDSHFAFPVGSNGRITGAHVRLRDGWRYTPTGTKTQPLVIGELHNGDAVHVFESQWDAFAFMDVSGERSGVIVTRGANNGGLIADLIPNGSTAYLWTQNDRAGEQWQAKICDVAIATVKRVRIPEQHKDLNDWTRKGGATVDNLLAAILDAETLCALPAIQDAATFLAQPIELPQQVLEGVLHRGGKMVAAGASKTFKTWFLIDLAASVATGAVWFNGYPTKKGAVLFVNFELPEPFFWHRVRTVADERQLAIETGMLHVWNLRGHILDWAKLQQQIQSDTYVLIILDPIYKLLLGRDENRAGDIASLLNELEVLAVRSGAAVAFGAHYSKGNQAQKESIDRIGGSGVFGRDPDTILNFTRHEEEDCFTVEMTLRNHPPQNPFVVRWEYPLFVVDSVLDPNRLKQAGGRPRLATQAQILDLLDEKPLKAVEWQKLAREEFGIASSTFYSIKNELQEHGRVESIGGAFRKT